MQEYHNDEELADNSPNEEKETDSSYVSEEKNETDTDGQFIIPEQATFFITEPEISEEELFPTENSASENRIDLLNVEHFSDYKSRALSESEEALHSDEEIEDELILPQEEYEENITIFDLEEAKESEPEPPKQKYDDPDRERYNPEKPRKVDGRFDFLELFIFTLLAVMLITTFIFRHSVVEGSSMENTLHEGEHLIISDLFYTPKKGDIVVCQDQATGLQKPVVKRIIATEGDTIEILPNGSVLVNGILKDEEDYVHLSGIDTFRGMPEITVPEGMVFVLGDHRNMSSDSRYFDSIFVREDAILGKVILRFYPFDKFGKVN